MSKYIDAEKLIAEIERRIDSWKVCGEHSPEGQGKDSCVSRVTELSDLLSFITSLQQEQPVIQNGKFVFPKYLYARTRDNKTIDMSYAPQDMSAVEYIRNDFVEQEQPEVDLEKFTEKIKTFQERYKYPEIVSIKGAMAFMARMFYQYPNVARQWYDSLPKATMD